MKQALLVSIVMLAGCADAAETSLSDNMLGICEGLDNSQMDVGISEYQECLGNHANLTNPANSDLCEKAGSTMSPDGRCILGE